MANLELRLEEEMLDDPILVYRNYSIASGVNSWVFPTDIKDDQVADIQNIDISIPGKRKKVPGYTAKFDLGANLVSGGALFAPTGGSKLLISESAGNIYSWDFAAASATERQAGLTSTDQVDYLVAGDTIYRLNSVDNIYYSTDGLSWSNYDASVATNFPKCTHGVYLVGRIFVAGNLTHPDWIYFSNTFNATGGAWGQNTRALKIETGDNQVLRGLVPWRQIGKTVPFLVAFKDRSIWQIDISNPSPYLWYAAPLSLRHGSCSRRAVTAVGDDVFFLSFRDGVRSLLKTIAETTSGGSEPLSRPIQSYIDRINWQYAVDKACSVFYDNKYFIAVPLDTSTYNNYVFIYNPLNDLQRIGNAWTIIPDVNVNHWIITDYNNVEQLYAGEASADGKMYLFWDLDSTDFNGTAITYQEDSKRINFGLPDHDKTGIFLEVEALITEAAELLVYAQLDGNGWTEIKMTNGERLDLGSGTPSLPVDLPFDLVGNVKVRGKYPLGKLGRFRNIQFRFKQETDNVDCQIVNWSTAAFKEVVELG